MKRWIRDPLAHFVLAGGVLFAAYGWWNGGAQAADPGTVRITHGDVTWLREAWTRQWQRRPTTDELRGLLADHLREELLSREARALGLDRDDTIVRRRLAQKLEFLVRDTAPRSEPTEGELRRLFDAERRRFLTPPRLSFRQVFFDPESRGAEQAVRDARAALEALSSSSHPAADAGAFGDATMLPRALEAADEQSIAAQFGAPFARALFASEPGRWVGPLESAFGQHVVRMDEWWPGYAPPFEEVRQDVAELWEQHRQDRRAREFYAALLRKYEIVADDAVAALVEPVALAGGGDTPASVRE